MRPIQVTAAALIAFCLLTATASVAPAPAEAAGTVAFNHHGSGCSHGGGTCGGGGSGGVFALAMSPGHVGGRSYPQCNWQHMWKQSIWDAIIGIIRQVIAIANGNPPPGTEQAELVLDINAPETNLYLDGALAQLLGRDSSYVVSYEGADVTAVHQIITYLLGTHEVGRFSSAPARDKADFHHNDSYPAIQRGDWSGGDLWWDPYYIPATEDGEPYDAGDPECEPGWIYFPRNSDPVTLVPDLQDYMRRLLPEVIPDLRPLDQDGGWAYVQVPMNFTTAASSLSEVEATASVYDPVSNSAVWAEATAVPVKIIFEPGDGSSEVACDVEDAVAAFDPEDPGFCSFTYLHSSNTEPSGMYDAVLAVEWRGEYRSSSNGTLVNFPIEPTYIEIDIPVAEARAAVSVAP